MLNDKVLNALNDQLNFELYSGYIYLAMAGEFESMNLEGFANWMKVQAKEEFGHAMKFYEYIIEQGEKVDFKAIDKPQGNWKTPLAMFEAAKHHESIVTKRINDIYNLAKKENDNATEIFLQWFVKEQIEEEASVDKIVSQLKMIKDAPGALFMFDSVLGKRA